MHTRVTDSANPYVAARHVYNERYLSLANSVRNWQLIAGGLLVLSLGLGSGIVYVTSKQQVIPYAVEVDEAGMAATIKELRATAVMDPLIIRAQLTRFVRDIRMISTDQEVMRRQMNDAYQLCLEPVQNFLSQYYSENKVADLAKRGRTFPLHIAVSPISPKSWRARWKEHVVGDDGAVIVENEWEATIEIALVLPQTREERQRSPLGLWIANLQWTQL